MRDGGEASRAWECDRDHNVGEGAFVCTGRFCAVLSPVNQVTVVLVVCSGRGGSRARE